VALLKLLLVDEGVRRIRTVPLKAQIAAASFSGCVLNQIALLLRLAPD